MLNKNVNAVVVDAVVAIAINASAVSKLAKTGVSRYRRGIRRRIVQVVDLNKRP